MDKTVLLTLGRLPKALELARCLKAAGCRVLIAEPFKWHLSRPSRSVDRCFTTPAPNLDPQGYLTTLLKIVNDEAVDLIVPVSEEALHVSLLADRLPRGTVLLSQDQTTLAALHDKYDFARQAALMDLSVPETFLATEPEAEVLALNHETVVKPRLGCSGTGMRFLDRGAELTEDIKSNANIVQRRVRGVEVSTLTFCREGTILAHVVYEGLVFTGTVATCFKRVSGASQVDRWVEKFVETCGYSGFIAFDFMVDDDGTAWPVECNPRMTSGIHFMDHGDLAAAVTGETLSQPVRMKQKQRFQEGHTTLTMVYASILRPQLFWRRLTAMLSARDVLWSLGDPAPFFLMTPMSWPILKQTIFGGRSFGEAATRDIEWLPGNRRSGKGGGSLNHNRTRQFVATGDEA